MLNLCEATGLAKAACTLLFDDTNDSDQAKSDFSFGFDMEGKLQADVTGVSVQHVAKGRVDRGAWTHIAYVFGDGALRCLLNGKTVGEKPVSMNKTNKIRQLPLSLCRGLTGCQVTEMRIWLTKRSDADVVKTMPMIIRPSEAQTYPGLRYCWLPLRKSGPAFPGSDKQKISKP